MICRDVASFAVPAQEIKTEGPTEVKLKGFQDLYLHCPNVVAGTRIVSDVDKILW